MLENIDKWAKDPFTVDISSLQIPSKISEKVAEFLEELKKFEADLSEAQGEIDEDEQNAYQIFSDAESQELEDIVISCSEKIKDIKEKKITWKARLSGEVLHLTEAHNAEVIGFQEAEKMVVVALNSKRKAAEDLAKQPKKKNTSADENPCRKLIVLSTSEVPLGQSSPDEVVPPEPQARELNAEEIVPPEPQAPERNDVEKTYKN